MKHADDLGPDPVAGEPGPQARDQAGASGDRLLATPPQPGVVDVRPRVVDVRSIMALQRLAGNAAVTAVMSRPPVPGGTKSGGRVLQREDSGSALPQTDTSPRTGNSPEQGAGDLKATLSAMADDLDRVLDFAASALAEGVSGLPDQVEVLKATVSRVRDAAASGDAKLQASVLNAFSGPNLAEAEAQFSAGDRDNGAATGPDAQVDGVAQDPAVPVQPLLAAVARSAQPPALGALPTGPHVQRDAAAALAAAGTQILRMDATLGLAGSEFGPVEWAAVGVTALVAVTLIAAAHAMRDSQPAPQNAMAMQGPRAAGQLTNVARHLARLLGRSAVGGVPSGEPPKNNNDNDKHWWSEIKASLRQFWQAIKGASRKQVLGQLLKFGYTESQISEIQSALKAAAELMEESVDDLLPPP
jgi:hypothetical protein